MVPTTLCYSWSPSSGTPKPATHQNCREAFPNQIPEFCQDWDCDSGDLKDWGRTGTLCEKRLPSNSVTWQVREPLMYASALHPQPAQRGPW